MREGHKFCVQNPYGTLLLSPHQFYARIVQSVQKSCLSHPSYLSSPRKGQVKLGVISGN